MLNFAGVRSLVPQTSHSTTLFPAIETGLFLITRKCFSMFVNAACVKPQTHEDNLGSSGFHLVHRCQRETPCPRPPHENGSQAPEITSLAAMCPPHPACTNHLTRPKSQQHINNAKFPHTWASQMELGMTSAAMSPKGSFLCVLLSPPSVCGNSPCGVFGSFFLLCTFCAQCFPDSSDYLPTVTDFPVVTL